jgi:hypothetical protein
MQRRRIRCEVGFDVAPQVASTRLPLVRAALLSAQRYWLSSGMSRVCARASERQLEEVRSVIHTRKHSWPKMKRFREPRLGAVTVGGEVRHSAASRAGA